jgi:hypothetical protein
MGMILLVILLLLFLGGVVVTPRTYAMRAGIAWGFGISAVVLLCLIVAGIIPWGWKS